MKSIYNFDNFVEDERACVYEWQTADVIRWLQFQNIDSKIQDICKDLEIDGVTLLFLTEKDIKAHFKINTCISLKKYKHFAFKIEILKVIHKTKCNSSVCSKTRFQNSIYTDRSSNTFENVDLIII